MARPQTLRLGTATLINTDRDHNGRWWITYYKQCSLFHRDAASVRNTLKYPKSTPSREALDAWLTELAADDSKRHGAVAADGLSAEHLATGFGPEAHADEEDPVANTKMVI